MRKLKTTDIPAFCRCLKKIGIKEEVQKIAKEANNAKDVWERGFDLIWSIFDIATEKKNEKYLYEFFAPIFEVEEKEFEDMQIDQLFEGFKQLAEENNLANFFKSAGALMK